MSLSSYSNKDTPYQNLDEIKETEVQTSLTRKTIIRRGERFLKGPIPLSDIAAAARLPASPWHCFWLFVTRPI